MENEKQEKAGHIYYVFAHNTVVTDLAPQVEGANRGGPGKKMKSANLCLKEKETYYRKGKGRAT